MAIGQTRSEAGPENRPARDRKTDATDGRSRNSGRAIKVGLATLGVALVTAQIVTAAPPVASFTISDSTLDTGQAVTFTSTASDLDGDIALREWDFDYDGSFTVDATGTSASTVYTTPGSRSVALRVTDTAGDPLATPPGDGTVDESTSVKSVSVVVPNTNPVASGITATSQLPNNGNRPHVGQTIAFAGTGSDADGDPITYEWSFGDGRTATGQNVTHAYGSHGPKTVTLTVRDNRGGTGTLQKTDLIINALPVANGGVVNGQDPDQPGQKYNHPLVGQSFVLTPQALPALPGQAALPGSSDAEDGANLASYAWDLDNNGSFERAGGTGGGCNGCTTHTLPAGKWTVGLRVTDSRGAVATGSVSFRVNTPPVPDFTWTPATPVRLQPIQFSSTSTDPDGGGDPLTYEWDLDNDGAFGESATGQPNERGQNPPKVSFGTEGEKTIKLRVTDTGGITKTIERKVLIQLSVPNAAFTSSPGAPLPGEAVAFRSTSTPSEAAKTIARLEWDFDYNPSRDTFAAGDVDATGANASRAFDSAGAKTVALKVTEGIANANGTISITGFAIESKTIVVNAPPQSSFRVAPGTPLTGDTVTFSSTAADPDGPIASQNWDLDGDGQFDDATGAVATRSYAIAGDYTARLRVTDDKGASSVSSGQVRIAGRPLPPPPPPPPPLRVLPGVAVQIAGRITDKGAKLTLLNIRAPKGARVKVTCKGRGCPLRSKSRKISKRALRFKQFERNLRAGIRLTIVVTQKGFIGRYTRFTIRRQQAPKRVDLCVQPGAKKPSACPAS